MTLKQYCQKWGIKNQLGVNLIQAQNYPRLHVIITKNSGDMSIIEFQEFLRSILQ